VPKFAGALTHQDSNKHSEWEEFAGIQSPGVRPQLSLIRAAALSTTISILVAVTLPPSAAYIGTQQ